MKHQQTLPGSSWITCLLCQTCLILTCILWMIHIDIHTLAYLFFWKNWQQIKQSFWLAKHSACGEASYFMTFHMFLSQTWLKGKKYRCHPGFRRFPTDSPKQISPIIGWLLVHICSYPMFQYFSWLATKQLKICMNVTQRCQSHDSNSSPFFSSPSAWLLTSRDGNWEIHQFPQVILVLCAPTSQRARRAKVNEWRSRWTAFRSWAGELSYRLVDWTA